MNEQELKEEIKEIKDVLIEVREELATGREWRRNHDITAEDSRKRVNDTLVDLRCDMKILNKKYDDFFIDYTKKTGIAIGIWIIIALFFQYILPNIK